jgi:hypothetical protein
MTTREAGSSLLGTPGGGSAAAASLASAEDRHRGRLALPSSTVLAVTALSLAGLGLRVAVLLRPLEIVDRLFIPDDTYYTLTIARSMAHGHGPTVDGSTLTSGFQPLLGFLLTPVFWITNSADAGLRADLALLVVVDAATILVLAWVAYRLAGKVAAVAAAGLWALSPVGVSMSLGGLETSLAMFCEISLVALWIWANDRQTALRWAVVGAVAGLTVLARTDGLLLVALLVLIQLWRGPRRRLVPAAVAGAVVLAPWWVWCTLTFGTPLPTSGSAAHQLLPFKSFSAITMSLAAGAVSGGPFQPWDWLRLRLIGHTTVGSLVFWLLVVVLLAVAALWVRRRRGRPIEAAGTGGGPIAAAGPGGGPIAAAGPGGGPIAAASVAPPGPGAWAVAASLPAFAAGLLVFYAWFGVTFYFTRYLAPVSLVAAVIVAAVVGRVASSATHWRPPALVGVAALLAVPVVGAARADAYDLTVRAVPQVPLGSAHFYDAATGYRQVTSQAMLVPPPGSVVGGWNSGAISYFAGDRVTVVNLDGVVNPATAALHNDSTGLARYVQRRHITFLVDVSLANKVVRTRLQQLDPGVTTRTVATFPAVGPSPPYEVAEIVWSSPPPGPGGRPAATGQRR